MLAILRREGKDRLKVCQGQQIRERGILQPPRGGFFLLTQNSWGAILMRLASTEGLWERSLHVRMRIWQYPLVGKTITDRTH